MIPVLRTSLVTAMVAGAIAAGGCSPAPRCPPGASCPSPPLPKVTFATTINGKPGEGRIPSYRVRPGENLVMRVAVTVPRHFRLTSLAFGISTGSWGGPNGTGGMNPILAHYHQPLSAGSHTFSMRWRVPHRRSGASLYLTFGWSSHQPNATVAGAAAQLIPN